MTGDEAYNVAKIAFPVKENGEDWWTGAPCDTDYELSRVVDRACLALELALNDLVCRIGRTRIFFHGGKMYVGTAAEETKP